MGDGVSEVMTKLRVTSSDGTSYSGDLLAIVDVLKNMTEIFRRAYYSPSTADMRVGVQDRENRRYYDTNLPSLFTFQISVNCALCLLSPLTTRPRLISCVAFQNFVQSVSNLLMEENRERWEEAQLVRALYTSSSLSLTHLPLGRGLRHA